MSLVAAGLVNVDGDIEDVVRAVTCAAEAGVGAGGTISDGGESRFIAETAQATASGERIDMGAIAFAAAYTWVVRFVFRAATGGDYHSLISRGGVFENNSQGAVGWRDGSVNAYQYQRNVSTLRGNETSGQPSLTAGTAYTLIYRCEANSKQLYYCAQDIGGAGVDYVQVAASTDAIGTDGSQHVWLGGPNTFTDQDRSVNAGILGVLIYDHKIDDTERDAIAMDGATGFYAQIPSASGPTIDTQPQADTVVAPAAASFTVAATTSGGTLLYQWQEDDGGGFANITDGSPYSGATTATLTIDPTATGLDGYDYRCNVTDDNGTTASDGAALTVLTGTVLDPDPTAATDENGQATVTLTTDVVDDTVDGQMKRITYTVNGVSISTTVRGLTP